jgi:hypothetical protein
VGASDSNDFAHHVQQERPGLRVFSNRADRDSHRGGRRRKPNQKNELLPYLPAPVPLETEILHAAVEIARNKSISRIGSLKRGRSRSVRAGLFEEACLEHQRTKSIRPSRSSASMILAPANRNARGCCSGGRHSVCHELDEHPARKLRSGPHVAPEATPSSSGCSGSRFRRVGAIRSGARLWNEFWAASGAREDRRNCVSGNSSSVVQWTRSGVAAGHRETAPLARSSSLRPSIGAARLSHRPARAPVFIALEQSVQSSMTGREGGDVSASAVNGEAGASQSGAPVDKPGRASLCLKRHGTRAASTGAPIKFSASCSGGFAGRGRLASCVPVEVQARVESGGRDGEAVGGRTRRSA